MSRLLTLAIAGALALAACTTASSAGDPDAGRTSTTTDVGSTAGVTTVPPTTGPSPTTATATSPPTSTATTVSTPGIVAIGDAIDGPGEFRRSLLLDGVIREFVVHVSPGAWERAGGAALVVDLHGLGSTPEAQDELSGFAAKADEEGFIVMQPQAAGIIPTWGAGFDPSPDVAFLRAAIFDISAQVDVDAVFAVGFSNGGGMVHRLACDAPDELVAVASVAGAYPDTGPCEGPVPLIAFHGTDDPVVPFGGAGVLLPDVEAWAGSWADRAGCSDSTTVDLTDDVDVVTWADCDPGQAVELYVIARGGHGWPGTASRSRLFDSTTTISATDLIWEFFASRR